MAMELISSLEEVSKDEDAGLHGSGDDGNSIQQEPESELLEPLPEDETETFWNFDDGDLAQDDNASSRFSWLGSSLKWIWILFRLAWKHSMRHPVMLLLGIITLTLIVFVMTFISAASSLAPGILTELVETEQGQTDLILDPRFTEDGREYLNYTRASEIWNRMGFETSAARYNFQARVLGVGNSGGLSSRVVAFDTSQEEVAGIGEWRLPRIQDNSCYISSSLAIATGLEVGDSITMIADFSELVRKVTGEQPRRAVLRTELRIENVLSDFKKKFPSDSSMQPGVMIELDSFQRILRSQIVGLRGSEQAGMSDFKIRDFATNAYLQIPSPREEYLHPDNVVVRERVISALRWPTYGVDFRQLNAALPILDALDEFNLISLFLSLLVNVAMVVFLVLAWVILYSLFGYTVETRSYEVGVMRVVGLRKIGVVELVWAQVLLVALPSWAIGLLLGQGVYYAAILFLQQSIGVRSGYALPGGAIAVACVLGLVVPFAAAILPVRRAISQAPAEAFAAQNRGNAPTAQTVQITRQNSRLPPALLSVCIITVVLGFMMYYLFPLALVSLNITLLLVVFMFLLLAMLMGFSLLFTSLDRVFSWITFWVCFWWHREIVKRLTMTNFVSHRSQNRKVFLMYNLTIALVIYLDVIARSQIQYLNASNEKAFGADLNLGSENRFACCRDTVEAAVAESPFVESFTWKTADMDGGRVMNLGKSFISGVRVYGVLPNFNRATFAVYTTFWSFFVGGSSWDEYLYTAQGSQVGALQQNDYDQLGLSESSALVFDNRVPTTPLTRLRPSATFNSLAGFEENRWSGTQPFVVSVPTFIRMSRGAFPDMANVPMESLIIRTKAGLGGKEYAELKKQILETTSSLPGAYYLDEVVESQKQVEDVSKVIEFGFICINVLAMVICSFSLITAMYANYFEHAKEIATLRALGYGSRGLFNVTFAESGCILVPASLLGIVAGWTVAITQSSQNGYFADLPPPIIFPWQAIVVVLVLTISSATVAALLVCLRGRKQIAQTLRQIA
ncbi:hypothetical protein NDN08_006898 [Rhodosorus marinus]|uniref:ABC3 transporter permease C-terminal domain-containing protein n=1 Tax=Rhodosorus marinus TaxID=101924 RepID=A0AAV8UIW5_9RHOD|nr:hypothetical protein NDN08_006898 [Rhodosorus marinus]